MRILFSEMRGCFRRLVLIRKRTVLLWGPPQTKTLHGQRVWGQLDHVMVLKSQYSLRFCGFAFIAVGGAVAEDPFHRQPTLRSHVPLPWGMSQQPLWGYSDSQGSKAGKNLGYPVLGFQALEGVWIWQSRTSRFQKS